MVMRVMMTTTVLMMVANRVNNREIKIKSGFSLAMASQPLLQCFLVALKRGKAGGRMKQKSAFVLLLQD